METTVAMTPPELVKPDGKAFNEHGIKVTMPFIVEFKAQFLVDAANERQAQIAIQRGITVNFGLTAFMLGFTTQATIPPPDVLAEFTKIMGRKG